MAGPGVLPEDWELRILNPGHVAMQRKANGQRGVKTDKVDLVAIRDLLLVGAGHEAPPSIARSAAEDGTVAGVTATATPTHHPVDPFPARAECGRCAPRPAG